MFSCKAIFALSLEGQHNNILGLHNKPSAASQSTQCVSGIVQLLCSGEIDTNPPPLQGLWIMDAFKKNNFNNDYKPATFCTTKVMEAKQKYSMICKYFLTFVLIYLEKSHY